MSVGMNNGRVTDLECEIAALRSENEKLRMSLVPCDCGCEQDWRRHNQIQEALEAGS